MTPEEKIAMTKAQRISRWNVQKLYYSIGKQYHRKWTVKRGEVYFVDLGQIKTVGKERIVDGKLCMLKQEIQEIDRKLLNALGLSSIIK